MLQIHPVTLMAVNEKRCQLLIDQALGCAGDVIAAVDTDNLRFSRDTGKIEHIPQGKEKALPSCFCRDADFLCTFI